MFERDEFLGRFVKVYKSSDILKKNIKGIILNETKNMFYILSKDKILKIPKKECIFMFDNKIIDGRKILFRPEERIKKIKKRC